MLSVLILAVVLFYVFDLGQYLTLEAIQANLGRLQAFTERHTGTMVLGFIAVYIGVVALSLPGATLLTLTSGALFGAGVGTLVVNIGATLGATLAFLAARFLFRDWVEEKYGEKLRPFNQGFSRNAIHYILFLRLVPIFPFFLINLVSGLTQVRLPVYFFGTMFGILPGSFVYANAGANLARIDSLKDVVSPGVLGALALLGIFALIPTFYKRFKGKETVSSPV
ncbi:MAG: TVP38/TMEM64 family protein, partial [Nitrospinaceae bacterium]|nr:TVP38/TMEM64 family protein [Nitrospinaceae bacterium]NIR55123.1 TVP38/TMEM64 family protein [Nitrospinaceae bacterium]NIS85543.1 TVP38/TMEM64 family protein [Nitrospinaceae bacterium]NIT82377.1 TVP38/TMEM64 family protein [Nitrospinaceae bacterium]NIU44590.1 TVP38/TMEM64 family protein [Nitrospinaceae bacterium]